MDSSYEWVKTVTIDGHAFTPDFNHQPSDYIDASTKGAAAIALTAGKTYSVSIVVEADNSSGDWNITSQLWIDFDGNGTVSDSTERVLHVSSSTSTWSASQAGFVEKTYAATFTVPTSAVSGTHWARVLENDVDANSLNACVTGGQSTANSASAVDLLVNTTAATKPEVASAPGKTSFKVYFGNASHRLNKNAKAKIKREFKEVGPKLNTNSRVTVTVTGWSQPTRWGVDSKALAKKRAKAVVKYLKSLGLKATYVVKAPGDAKVNSKKSRRASVVIKWTNAQ